MSKPNLLDWFKHLLRWLHLIHNGPKPVPPVVVPDPGPIVPDPGPPPEPPKPPEPPAPKTLERLHVEGRTFRRPDGSVWDWHGITAFRLVELVAHGREDEAEAFLAWCEAHGLTLVRVLTTAVNLFDLSPEDGRRALPKLLTMAEAHGLYVEVVCLADTAQRAFPLAEHVAGVGSIAAQHVNALVQIANEPAHHTQAPQLADPAYLKSLRGYVPRVVLTTLGPRHGADDGNPVYPGGDYATVHFDRADGDEGWRWVRHQREGWDTMLAAGTPLVSDEPRRDDLEPQKHFAVGAMAGMFGLGDTFHCAAGLQCTIPDGAEVAALDARQRGWQCMAGWSGLYYTVESSPNSPLAGADFNRVLRVWASVNGDEGRALALRVNGDPGIDWREPWRVVSGMVFGQVQAWRIAR